MRADADLEKFFKRNHAASDAVPLEVQTAISETFVIYRPCGWAENEDGAQVYFNLPGFTPSSRNAARRVLEKIYPELTPGQLDRAEKMLLSTINHRAREQAELQFEREFGEAPRSRNRCKRAFGKRREEY